MIRAAVALAVALTLPALAHAQGAKVYAAGSLRAAFEDASAAFSAYRAGAVRFEFGPSGILKDRLAKGEPADLFASANMDHAQALAQSGKSGAVRMFARNRLCALAPAALGITAANLLERMLDEKVKLGTSIPKDDPPGDYASQVFERAEKLKPGAYQTLSKKVRQLAGDTDISLTYCTNAALARKEDPKLASIALPEALAVGADYGLVVMNGASPTGHAFANFLLGEEGRRILASQGFSPP